MSCHLNSTLLTALAAALLCSLVALAAQASEMQQLHNIAKPFEYRAEVAHMFVTDQEYLRRLNVVFLRVYLVALVQLPFHHS